MPSSELVWVHDPTTGGDFALLHVDAYSGLWVVRSRFPAGTRVGLHLHSGPVSAITLSGRWSYPELATACGPGDYLVEEAGVIHSLTVANEDVEVIFSITGAIIYLSGGAVERIEDWRTVWKEYAAGCQAMNKTTKVIGAPDQAPDDPSANHD